MFRLPAMAENGHERNTSVTGVIMFSGDLNFMRSGGGFSLLGRRLPHALAAPVLASGVVTTPSSVDTNDFHCSYGHVHECLWRETAQGLGDLLGGRRRGIGCSMAKGYRKAIMSTTSQRSENKLGRTFVDLSGPKTVPSTGGGARNTSSLCETTSRSTLVGVIYYAARVTPRPISKMSSAQTRVPMGFPDKSQDRTTKAFFSRSRIQ